MLWHENTCNLQSCSCYCFASCFSNSSRLHFLMLSFAASQLFQAGPILRLIHFSLFETESSNSSVSKAILQLLYSSQPQHLVGAVLLFHCWDEGVKLGWFPVGVNLKPLNSLQSRVPQGQVWAVTLWLSSLLLLLHAAGWFKPALLWYASPSVFLCRIEKWDILGKKGAATYCRIFY